jgi:regulatory protein
MALSETCFQTEACVQKGGCTYFAPAISLWAIINSTVIKLDRNQAYNMAIRMLGRREHSEQEVRLKLRQKFRTLGPDVLDDVIQTLIESELLSDARFAEMRIRSRVSRGYGPFYIRQELSAKGIDAETISECLDEAQVDWLAAAQALVERRFSGARKDAEVWAKAARFLQRRGFSAELVSKALAG